MTKDEALKQAYDALIPLSNAGSPQEREILTDDDQVAAYKATKAIEQVLNKTTEEMIGLGVGIWRKCPVCDENNCDGEECDKCGGVGAIFDTTDYTTPPQRKPQQDDVIYLLGALKNIASDTYDSWTNGANAQRTAIAAIDKYERAHGIKD